MRTLKLTVLGALGVFCLAVVLHSTLAEAKAPEGAMRVILTTVKVAEKKTDGAAWDINDGKPDLVVSIKNLSDTTQKEVVTDARNDTYQATFDSKTVLATAGQRLQILVEDKDAVANDTIGKATLDVTAEMLKKGSHTASFGQVKELTLTFEKP